MQKTNFILFKFWYRKTILILLLLKTAYFLISVIKSKIFTLFFFLLFICFIEYLFLNYYLFSVYLYISISNFFWASAPGQMVNYVEKIIVTLPVFLAKGPLIFKYFIFIFIIMVLAYNRLSLISVLLLCLNLDFNFIVSFYVHLLNLNLFTGLIPAPLEGTFFYGRNEFFPYGSEEGTSNYSSTSTKSYLLQEREHPSVGVGEITTSSASTPTSSAVSSPSAFPKELPSSSTTKFLNKAGNSTELLKIPNFFHTLELTQKYDYIQTKFYQKGLDFNVPSLDWIIEKINKTDGSMASVNSTIDNNLNSILKIEREAKLNSHSFKTIRPFLLGKDYSSPNQIPNTVPYKTPNNFED